MSEGRPEIDEALARTIAARWGLAGELVELGSYADRNFALTTADGRRFVLKVASLEDPREVLELQAGALAWLAARPSGALVPRLIPTPAGAQLVETEDRLGRPSFARVLSWLDGRLWAELELPSEVQLTALGRALGRLDRDLHGYEHPAADRPFAWNLVQAEWIADELHRFETRPERHATITAVIDDLRERVIPRLSELPRQVIHGDVNELNLLVAGDAIAGFIDFGDVCRAPVICELAIALTYAIMGRPSPADTLDASVAVCRGFQASRPLRELELELLFDLIRARLAVSVTCSTIEHAREPDNEHVTVSQRGAWALLDTLAAIGRDGFCEALLHDGGATNVLG